MPASSGILTQPSTSINSAQPDTSCTTTIDMPASQTYSSTSTYLQCRINNSANGAAAPGPPQLGAPHKGFFFCTLILPGTLFEANFIYIIAKMRSLPDPAGGLTAPPRPPAVLHAASGSVGLGHRGSHSPREKPPTKVLHQAPHIGNPALPTYTTWQRRQHSKIIMARMHDTSVDIVWD